MVGSVSDNIEPRHHAGIIVSWGGGTVARPRLPAAHAAAPASGKPSDTPLFLASQTALAYSSIALSAAISSAVFLMYEPFGPGLYVLPAAKTRWKSGTTV